MKIRHIFTIVFIAIVSIASAQNVTKNENGVLLEHQSRYGFNETVEKLSATITEKAWKVTIIHDLQLTMQKNGKTVLPVKVIELCNPDHAYQILGNDLYRSVSPMLPCRISVYEKSDGNTYISRMNAPAFAKMIGGEAAKTIVQAFDDTEEMLKDYIQ